MSQKPALLLLCLLATAAASAPATAQIPDEFTNLKLLNPEISKDQLVDQYEAIYESLMSSPVAS